MGPYPIMPHENVRGFGPGAPRNLSALSATKKNDQRSSSATEGGGEEKLSGGLFVGHGLLITLPPGRADHHQSNRGHKG
jgi:hypothetical protein